MANILSSKVVITEEHTRVVAEITGSYYGVFADFPSRGNFDTGTYTPDQARAIGNAFIEQADIADNAPEPTDEEIANL